MLGIILSQAILSSNHQQLHDAIHAQQVLHARHKEESRHGIMYKVNTSPPFTSSPKNLTDFNTNKEDHLKILVEAEVAPILIRLLRLTVSGLLIRARHDARFLVVSDALLEEIGLAGQRDRLHEVERVGRIIVFGVPEREQQPIGNEFDILLHERRVHAQ